MIKDIETEIKHRFFRPSKRSIDIYREKKQAIQDAVVKALAPSKNRINKLWTVLLGVAIISIAAQSYA
jgi:hypothetical protein